MRKINKIILIVFLSILALMAMPKEKVYAVTGSYNISGPSELKVGEKSTYTFNYQATEKSTFAITFRVKHSSGKSEEFQILDMGTNLEGTTSGSRSFEVEAGATAGNIVISVVEQDITTFNKEQFQLAGSSKTVKVVSPQKSSNANLKSLAVSSGTLSPSFNANTLNYTAQLPVGTTKVNIAATKADSKAENPKGTGSISVTDGGSHNVSVTAEDGTTKTYKITFSILKPNPKERVETKTQTIDFDTIYQDDPELSVGQERVINAGTKGQMKITYTVKWDANDPSVQEEWIETNRDRIKEPVDRIVARGTKPVTTSTNLKSLFVDGADIRPAFSSNVTKYTFTLREPADTVNLRAEAEATGASITGLGTITLTKPTHVQKIVVSRNGQQTAYEVTIQQPADVVDETPTAEIEYDGKTVNVVLIEESIAGFTKGTLQIQGQEVPVLSNGKGLHILHIDGDGLYLANASGTIYSRYNPVTINGVRYFALDVPEADRTVDQMRYAEFTLGQYRIYGYVFEAENRANYKVFYLQNEEGSIDRYLYNIDDESLILLDEASFETTAETQTEGETNPSDRLEIQDLVIYAGLILSGILLIVLLLLIIRRIRERS